jgi:uncharacterized protein
MSGIRLLTCRACGHVWQFRRALCPVCAASEIEPIESKGGGTVWSVTTVHRAPTPELDRSGGYGICLVTLDEGARVMARAPADLSIGERVTLRLENGLPTIVRDGKRD